MIGTINAANFILERMVIMSERNHNLRESLILAGIQELNRKGIQGFSLRSAAEACGVSCAAPYRHFKDKKEFMAAIIDYVNDIWAARQEEILTECDDTLRQQIISIILGYIRFIMENPQYRAILMLKDQDFDNLYHKKRTQFGSLSQTLNAQLLAASGYTPEVWERKLMMVRALIFGMVFLYDAGEFEYNEKTMEHIRYTLNREFDLP